MTLRLCAQVLAAVVRARRKTTHGKLKKRDGRERRRRRALAKLGGRCACCGLGEAFAPVIEFHHINHNGKEHERVRGALGVSLPQWILAAENPSQGLFAVEPLCVVCHRMHHQHGGCPHREERRLKAAS